ncbi:hypothetical protein GYMLUDRAFT_44305 [Collybiopsis luxurians FD-317 M1]|uniref:DUF6593 domain-containing protein n=1 Tax=Collybiopsis luxurians FD-317 M1 TaxID=944289 RepID=A0A0D0CMH6_9AGAR|nr:hypothetical protein GYMLUDRAFT_44305 [Collybiopsis luxurians FD-317 M1]
MNDITYDLFFTGKDDPRACVIIGEDTKPVFFSFETFDRGLAYNTQTIVTRGKELIASLEWTVGNHLGMATINSRRLPMSHLVLPGSTVNARNFVSSSDGRRYEWRRCYPDGSAYDLFLLPSNVRIAAFRRMHTPTVVGPSHALLQYQFSHDLLLLEALLSLCLFRWIDLHGM